MATLLRIRPSTGVPGVRPVEQHHGGARAARFRDHRSSDSARASGSPPGRIRSLPPAEMVIRSGLRLTAVVQLLVHDLLQQPPADGQVGIGKVLVAPAQFLRHPVRPAPVAARAGRLGISDALGKGVAHGHVAGPGVLCRRITAARPRQRRPRLQHPEQQWPVLGIRNFATYTSCVNLRPMGN